MAETEEQVVARLAAIERRSAAFGKRLFKFQRAGVLAMATAPHGCGLFDDVGLGKTVQMVCTPAPGAPALVCTLGAVKDSFAQEWALWRPEFSRVIIRRRADFRWPVPNQVVFVNPEIMPPSKRELELLLEEMCHAVGRIPDHDLIRGYPRPTTAAALAAMNPTQRAEHDQKVAVEAKRLRAEHDRYVETLLSEAQKARPAQVKDFRELRALRARVLARPPYQKMDCFLDEAHRAKNPEAKFTRRWREVARMGVAHGGRAFPATATPILNEMGEQYEVLQAAGLGARAFGTKVQYELLAKTNPDEFKKRLSSVCIRRLADDHLDLPPYTVQTISVPLAKEQRAIADEVTALLKAVGVDIEKATLEAIQTAMETKIPRELYSKLRKVLAQAKIPHLLEIAANYREQKTAFVVACMHKDPVLALEKLGDCVLITGDQKEREKHDNKQAFQDGRVSCCALTTTSAGAGITLHRARIMIVVDYPWNPGILRQLFGRIRRIGQTASNLLYQRLVCQHVIEERVERLIHDKMGEIMSYSDVIAEKPTEKERL